MCVICKFPIIFKYINNCISTAQSNFFRNILYEHMCKINAVDIAGKLCK